MPQRSSAFVTNAPAVTGNVTFANFIYESIGHEVLLETKSGERVIGVLAGVSNDRDVGLYCAAYLLKDEERLLAKRSDLHSKLRFAASAWVTLSRILTEEKSIKEFATDADYHEQKKPVNGDQLGEFEEWNDDENGGDGGLGGIEEMGGCGGEGWTVDAMFEQNGSRVKSDFREDLSQYTTVEVGEVTEEARREADRIARDIEASAGSRRMQLLENDDEERDLDKATEFGAPSGRRTRHPHPRTNPQAPRCAGQPRGRGGRQFGTSQQNFQSPGPQQQYGSRGGFQGRGNAAGPRFADRNAQNGTSMPGGGDSWRQTPSGPPSARRSVEPSTGGSYSAVVAAGMKPGAAPSNDVRMSSGNAPPSRIVETGAEKASRNNRRAEDLRTWGSNFDKAYSQQTEAPSPGAIPATRPGNAWQSGPPHRGKNSQAPKSAEEPVEKKAEETPEEVQTPSTSDVVEKPKPVEEQKTEEAAAEAAHVGASEASTEEKPKEAKSTFKFNPNAPVFTPKSVPQPPATQPMMSVMPMQAVMHAPPPASSTFPQMVVGYNTPQSYGGPAVLYPPGQVYVQQYPVAPQQSGTQTPNGSSSGVAPTTQGGPSGGQQPPRPGSISRQQSQGQQQAPIYAPQFQQAIQQQAVYTPYPQQVYQTMPIYAQYPQQGYHPVVPGQPPVTSTAQGFQAQPYGVPQQPQAGIAHVQPHYGHMQQGGAAYHPQNTSESQCSSESFSPSSATVILDVAESQAQSTNGSTSSSNGCPRSSNPTTPQPVPQTPQQQHVNGSGVASSATSGYNTPHPGTPVPSMGGPPMYPLHGQNAPSMYPVMYQPAPGHHVFQIPPHQGGYLPYQQPRNSSFPQNVVYAPQQPHPQSQQLQNS
ncbi:hypothetical protein QR680_012645 [Steinernema hermaphroditum]|uniref:LsmAD domain-containing protein n=1 Tax=Steinernema hermaphroditum TaxID=289476 RepID=A0AA39M134_9BILA|nr:hypothetical protein QR680_012645 [Steinernema hermaphroditum]